MILHLKPQEQDSWENLSSDRYQDIVSARITAIGNDDILYSGFQSEPGL